MDPVLIVSLTAAGTLIFGSALVLYVVKKCETAQKHH